MASPTPFKDKVILITGAARGIGLATSHYLALRGATLVLVDVKQSELDAASAELKSKYPDLQFHCAVVDVANTDAVEGLVADTVKRFGKLSGADKDFERVIGINAGGVMKCMRAELRVMEDGASIVNTASVAGLVAYPGLQAYVASKHAVVGLTKAIAKEVGGRGIRVNAVCPGAVDTPMLKEQPQEANNLPPPPIARMGKPEEIAAVVAYLLGDESKYTTGACIPVDGGGFAC
ncbi:NAD(P)-binding protein [Bimuria novae-zelandiae CBS 107.79]|uniref:NAD(P)-binding protein n=1 Tax=Bimuria novae-zelandiae CBS 107.79 TaxID=1447943 RepID=A0A6A5UN14_9PLEO|nr:NAD(P)-binding protein [Bimuria novae-zelandiae CBS 107.79]